jgi:hypothetical protein
MPPVSPGQNVRVHQSIFVGPHHWSSAVEGTVESCRPEVTGSWYAHGKNDKLWLIRLRIRKPDGELTTLVIDHNSRLEVLTA